MDLKKTILVVKTNLEDMRNAKEELVREEDRKKQLVKYSDNAVETKTKLYIFKTVIVPRQILDHIYGYAEVQADELLTELENLVLEARNICKSSTKSANISASTPAKATQGSPRGAQVVADVDASKEGNQSEGDEE